MLPKSISEEHFIRVLYDYLVLCEKTPPSMEEKEEMARIALGLHKEYWFKCMQDVRGKE